MVRAPFTVARTALLVTVSWAAICCRAVPAAAANAPDAPTAAEVVAICGQNRARLDPLHFQVRLIEERTEAYGASKRQQAEGLTQLLVLLDSGEGVEELEAQMPGISSAAYRQVIRDEIETAQELAKPFRLEHQYEYFIAGENYQVRSPTTSGGVAFQFPAVAINADTLTKDFAGVRIYSRSAGRSHAGQIWQGHAGPDEPVYAMTTAKHFGGTHNTRVPPFAYAVHPTPHAIHPFDLFLDAPPEHVHVVGQETRDGRLLTIVDALAPTETKGWRTGADGQEEYDEAYWIRAWLDLDRGGVPMLLHMWRGSETREFDERYRDAPWRVVTTTAVEPLGTGGFYPARTVEEEFNIDPASPSLSEAQWAEVRSGKRKAPPQVVFERHIWECSALDTTPFGGDEFFVLTFPAEAVHFDQDGKVVGALESSPPVSPGEQAPPLNVARWVDGDAHTLEEFRGKVVLLHFWGFSCSGCLAGIPALNALEERFKGEPVVFLSIHEASPNAEKLALRIETLAAERNWRALAAIDAGTTIHNSATFHAYGCTGQPTYVIIGADGDVAWNSENPVPGMETIVGKDCDEFTAADQAIGDRYMKAEFEAAGEIWPLPAELSEEEQQAVLNRILAFQIGRHIDTALEAMPAN